MGLLEKMRARAKVRTQNQPSGQAQRADLRAKMLAKVGLEWHHVPLTARMGKTFREQGIPYSPEFERIKELPRRNWETIPELAFLQDEMTDWLKMPQGTRRFRPLQAMSLADLHDYGGTFVPGSVGSGKTDVCFCAQTVTQAQHMVLLIPAGLRQKTEREFKKLAQHWIGPTNMSIVHYQGLGREKQAELLDDLRPDLIVADEVHYLKNLKAACTRRVRRYMEEYPDTMFVGASGTITKRSLMDFHHLLRWCLGPQNMPLPEEASEARRWSQVVDEKIPNTRRLKPGVLCDFTEAGMQGEQPKKKNYYWEEDPNFGLSAVRRGLGQRIFETPGVVASLTDDVDASIHMHFYDPKLPIDVANKIEEFQERKQDQNGLDLVELFDIWRHTRELVCGFFYKWVEEAPEYWLTARRAWYGFLRAIHDLEKPGLDSLLQITNAVIRGDLDDNGRYAMWKHVENDFKPKTVPEWIDESIMLDVVRRVEKKPPTLIWVEHVATGEKLAELSGWKFFHHKGLDKDKNFIDDVAGRETAIVSIHANKEGRNLQAWSRNHVVSAPPVGYIVEQFFGRTHRQGQDADNVYYEIMLGHSVIHDGWDQACADAAFISETTGTSQKLMLADMTGTFCFQH